MLSSTIAETYEEWMKDVDKAVYMFAGLSVHDLPDWTSRDAYDIGDSPEEGARQALCNAGFFEDDDLA